MFSFSVSAFQRFSVFLVKVVIFGPAYPFRGGISQFSQVLARSLSQGGHEVKLVNFKKQFPKILFPGTTQFDEKAQAHAISTERVFTLWNPLTWLETARAIRRYEPELILFAWWMPFFGVGYWAVAKLLGKLYRGRLVFLLHNVIPHERRFGDVFFSRLALNQSRSYLALSRAEEKEMHRLFPQVPKGNIYYSPHPLYDNYAPYKGSQADARRELGLTSSRILLFFGFVREYKGLDVLLRAMPQIRQRYPDLTLAIVGEFYQDRAKYDDLIRDLKIESAVLVHSGYVSGNDVGTWFAACDVVVLPYRSATQSGIVPIAYALSTPVITTDVGGLGEVVLHGTTGFVVPPEDPVALAEAVGQFYEKGGRPAFEQSVKSHQKDFSWETMRTMIEKIGLDLSKQ